MFFIAEYFFEKNDATKYVNQRREDIDVMRYSVEYKYRVEQRKVGMTPDAYAVV